jgi:hypothetical protein
VARRRLGTKKAKRVAYRFIDPASDDGRGLYHLLRELIDQYHPHLSDAKIALAWNISWGPDVDGRVTLGKCKKVGDLEREIADLQAYDFVIILQHAFWLDLRVTDLQRRALLDHELCHAAVKLDANGHPEVDERGRTVYRVRKHDLEEFACIGERYGCWKGDVVQFYQALEQARARFDGQWVGYRSLQHELRKAGLSVPLDTIQTWSDDDRREAATWASLRNDLPTRFRDEAMPPFLVTAVRPETLA